MGETVDSKKILTLIAGILLAGGSAAVWHFWHIDGFVAILAAGAGVILIGRSCGIDFGW